MDDPIRSIIIIAVIIYPLSLVLKNLIIMSAIALTE
jgi:hypothetical protein